MTHLAVPERPRPRSLRSGAFFVSSLALGLALVLAAPVAPTASCVAAQEPDTAQPPPLPAPPVRTDTIPRPGAGDTIPSDTVPVDTLGPPPGVLPALGRVGPASWARGTWEWDRSALRRLPALSVLDLLERLPGLVPVRVDLVNQAETAGVFGSTARGIDYVIDGFQLDPLTTASFDASRLPLLALERVRVERRLTGATVWIETQSPDHPRPRSIVEAGTGDYDINLFRGIFLSPDVLGGPLGLGFERLGGEGILPGGTSNHLGGWVKWTWLRDSAGVQVEYRQSDMDRTGIGAGVVGARRDWVVRARARRGPVTGEVYAGASSMEDERDTLVLREGTPVGGARLRAEVDGPIPLEGRAALRLRAHPRLPGQELELALRAVPTPYLAVDGEVVQGWWESKMGTGRWAARSRKWLIKAGRSSSRWLKGGRWMRTTWRR